MRGLGGEPDLGRLADIKAEGLRRRQRRRQRTVGFACAGILTVLAAAPVVRGARTGGDRKLMSDASGMTLSLDERLGIELHDASDKERKVENAIQICMKARGFDYVAVDPAARRAALLGATGVSEDTFEERYGYGITTLYEQRRAQAAGEENARLRAALSEPKRKAYDRALRGDRLDATFDDAVSAGDFTRLGGCTKEAADKVYGGADVRRSLQRGLEELETGILADPRMVKAVTAWSGCMRKGGYQLHLPADVDRVLKQKLAAIVGSDPLTAAEPGAPPAYDQAALEALQEEEVRMVATDIACEEEHLKAVETSVRDQYEQEFRDQNADLLSRRPRRDQDAGRP